MPFPVFHMVGFALIFVLSIDLPKRIRLPYRPSINKSPAYGCSIFIVFSDSESESVFIFNLLLLTPISCTGNAGR